MREYFWTLRIFACFVLAVVSLCGSGLLLFASVMHAVLGVGPPWLVPAYAAGGLVSFALSALAVRLLD